MPKNELVEGLDYYINEQGLFVFTSHYLSKRGYCCGSGCKHCPYTREEFAVAKQRRHRGGLMGILGNETA